jgi:hypothetical protein
MARILGLALLGLFISVPANAQRSMSGSPGPTGTNVVGGATSGGGPGSAVGGGGTVGFHTLPAAPPTQFQMVDISGQRDDYIPSSWTEFERGLARGQAELAAGSKTLGEVAAENRRAARPKAKFEIIQDAAGTAVIQLR